MADKFFIIALILRKLKTVKAIMHLLRSFWFPILLGITFCIFFLIDIVPNTSRPSLVKSFPAVYKEGEEWTAPSENEIPSNEEGNLIRYGKALIGNTAKYLGPKGTLGPFSNGMNCQNCHLAAGTQNFANPFSAVASTYPKYRDRSGSVESIAFRVNDCMQRSMNGKAIDSLGPEMQAMIAYIKWVGKAVPKGVKPLGAGTESLPFLNRPADPSKGQIVYVSNCQRCHGQNGEGVLLADSSGYTYPPLWGKNSYNVGAGMYRLAFLAGFIKNNMPFGITKNNPQLNNEQAWDVAAYIASQPRPALSLIGDWKDISKKPLDYPFGPYADRFPEKQHKYGPFEPIKKEQKR